jgi:hypothetical protein
MFWLHFGQLVRARDCTKHVLRVSHHQVAVTESVRTVRCALETSRSPPAVLRKREAAHQRAPVRLRFGGGAAPGHHAGLSLLIEEREQVSKQTRRVRAKRLGAHGRSEPQ